MKKYSVLLVLFILIAIISCKKDEPPALIQNFTASQGTYIGVVHLAVEEVTGADNYNIARKNPETNQWEEIYWESSIVCDDGGWGLTDNKLRPGQVYEYRVRAHSDKGGFNDWSEVVTGYIFTPSPKIKNLQYTRINPAYDDYNLTYTIIDKLPDILNNLNERRIFLYRSETTDFNDLLIFKSIEASNKDSLIIDVMETSITYSPEKTYYYKLKIVYRYGFQNVTPNTYELFWDDNGLYTYESAAIDGSTITGSEGGGTVSYNVNNYGEINQSSTGAKKNFVMCKDGSTIYLGYFDATTVLYGKPNVMKNTGTSWTSVSGTLPVELVNDNTIDEYDMDASSGVLYLAALSSDTIHVYKNDGAWSVNLTTPLLWGASEPNYLDIAVLNNELYLTIIQGDDIKVFKYQGTDWAQIGSVVASGNSFWHTNLKNIDGTLYIWYEEMGSGSSVTLHLKHLDGTSWVNDLQWVKDNNPVGFDLVKAGSNLYFKYGTFDAKGNICKITSSTSAEELYELTTALFNPESITSDASGNIIISCVTGTDADNLHHEVLIYDGSTWKKVDDDYSETSYHGNSAVQALNNDIHFVYGLKSSEDSWNIPTVLKAKKYSK